MTAAACIFSWMGFTGKEQNHYARSDMRVEDGDVCHIPQLDSFFDTFLASCQGLTWQLWRAFPLPLSHSCLPTNNFFFFLGGGRGVNRNVVSLSLISESSPWQRFLSCSCRLHLLHMAVVPIFCSRSGCSPGLCDLEGSACHAGGFPHWQFPGYNLEGVIFYWERARIYRQQ